MNFNLCLILAVLGTAFGAAFFNPGPCPEGRSEGEFWFEGCSRCDCKQRGYGCAGCGLVAAWENCHIIRNDTAPWPDCCPTLKCDKQ